MSNIIKSNIRNTFARLNGVNNQSEIVEALKEIHKTSISIDWKGCSTFLSSEIFEYLMTNPNDPEIQALGAMVMSKLAEKFPRVVMEEDREDVV